MKRWMLWLLLPLCGCSGDVMGDTCEEDEDCDQADGLICVKATDATEKEEGTCEVDDAGAAD